MAVVIQRMRNPRAITDERGQVTFPVTEDATELTIEAPSSDLVGGVTVALGEPP